MTLTLYQNWSHMLNPNVIPKIIHPLCLLGEEPAGPVTTPGPRPAQGSAKCQVCVPDVWVGVKARWLARCLGTARRVGGSHQALQLLLSPLPLLLPAVVKEGSTRQQQQLLCAARLI